MEHTGRMKDAQLIIDAKDLPGGSNTLFRVMATDGVNTAFDDSNQPISIPNKAPLVGIISPYDNSTFWTAHTVILNGYANDLEDGNLDGKALSWTSNRGGSLGYGSSISASNLEPGDHVITLSAKDKDGGVNSTNITIHILPFNIVTAKLTTGSSSPNVTGTNNTLSSLTPESKNETMPSTTTAVTGGEQAQAGKKNNPPKANAGPDMTVKSGDQVILDGATSQDRDKDTLAFKWSQVSDKSSIDLKASDMATSVFTAPNVDKDTQFTFKLMVDDGHKGGTDTDTVKITVKAQGPSTESGPDNKVDTESSGNSNNNVNNNNNEGGNDNQNNNGLGTKTSCPNGEGPDPDTGRCAPLP